MTLDPMLEQQVLQFDYVLLTKYLSYDAQLRQGKF